MEGGALFNPGFLGGNFLWWVGQVADDRTWRENVKSEKYENPKDNKGWGYRYKVRIIGLHDKQETLIPSDQLPWAQVMYPITAGGGQGGSFQTPGIKQGMFVFGFFLDGQDQQVPVIMGVLGNNAQTPLNLTTSLSGSENFTAQSGFANSHNDQTKLTSDRNLAVKSPDKGKAPTKESTDPHQQTVADVKKDRQLKKKRPLKCPDKKQKSGLKSIQTILEELTKDIQEAQKAFKNFKDAASLRLKKGYAKVQEWIKLKIQEASREIAKYAKEIYINVQNWLTDQYNKKLKPLLKNLPGSSLIESWKLKLKGLEALACKFNALMKGLGPLINQFLNDKNSQAHSKSKNSASSGGTGGSDSPYLRYQQALRDAGGNQNLTGGNQNLPDARIIGAPPEELIRSGLIEDEDARTPLDDIVAPALPIDGYGTPTPICTTEELMAFLLGQHLNDIMITFNEAVKPIADQVRTTIDQADTTEANTLAQSSGKSTINDFAYTVTSENVDRARKSGDLIDALARTLASNGLGMSQTHPIEQAKDYFQFKNYYGGLVTLKANQIVGPQRSRGNSNIISDLVASKGDLTSTFVNTVAVYLFGQGVSGNLIQEGKYLLDEVIQYLIDNDPGIIVDDEYEDEGSGVVVGGSGATMPTPLPAIFNKALKVLSGVLTLNGATNSPYSFFTGSTNTLFTSNGQRIDLNEISSVLKSSFGQSFPAVGYASDFVSVATNLANGDMGAAINSIPGMKSGVGNQVAKVFNALKDGNLGKLTYEVGLLSRVNPKILDAVIKNVIQVDMINPENVQNILDAFGVNFDVGAALGFISSISAFFACDPKPKCSPNTDHTLQEGGNARPGKEQPNLSQIANLASNAANALGAKGVSDAIQTASSVAGVVTQFRTPPTT